MFIGNSSFRSRESGEKQKTPNENTQQKQRKQKNHASPRTRSNFLKEPEQAPVSCVAATRAHLCFCSFRSLHSFQFQFHLFSSGEAVQDPFTADSWLWRPEVCRATAKPSVWQQGPTISTRFVCVLAASIRRRKKKKLWIRATHSCSVAGGPVAVTGTRCCFRH